jgi:predicted metal-dependent enzyme (double-stranded beta helix superfamily)
MTPPPLARLIAALAADPSLATAAQGLPALVAHDGWLPDRYAQADPVHYRQYCLHACPAGRFSIVSFVWGPGQQTPVHDHGVWGVVGQLRGAEWVQDFAADGTAPPRPIGAPRRLVAGDVEAIPAGNDIHQVANALPDGVSVSIHVYGTDIGRHPRHVYPAAGGRRPFVSGYANGPDTPAFA